MGVSIFIILAAMAFIHIVSYVGLVVWICKREKKTGEEDKDIEVSEQLKTILDQIQRAPDIIVSKAVGRTNVERGALGEMIAFLRLKADYDKILPFHDIVDFVGIKFPANGKEGSIDFIDIKTGKARLTKEQTALQEIIKKRKIGFIKAKLSVNDLIPPKDIKKNEG